MFLSKDSCSRCSISYSSTLILYLLLGLPLSFLFLSYQIYFKNFFMAVSNTVLTLNRTYIKSIYYNSLHDFWLFIRDLIAQQVSLLFLFLLLSLTKIIIFSAIYFVLSISFNYFKVILHFHVSSIYFSYLFRDFLKI